jgi:DnaJ-class molecular chaperone
LLNWWVEVKILDEWPGGTSMTDAYEVLGVAPGSTEEQIRQRYLELVRQYPPERHPDRFAAIRQAYEALRDPIHRWEAELFTPPKADTLAALLSDIQQRLQKARIPVEELLSLAERA